MKIYSITKPLRDRIFQIATAGRGYPIQIGDGTARVHSDLRRYSVSPGDALYTEIKLYLKPGQTFLDIGANIGLYSLAAGLHVGSGRIIALEPDPRNFGHLSKNIKLNPKLPIQAFQIALMEDASSGSHVDFFIHKDPNQSALASKDCSDMLHHKVSASTLGQFCAEHAHDPAFIKIDTEGAELPILRGGVDWIKANKPTLAIEYHGGKCAAFGYHVNDLWNFLSELGYQQRIIQGNREKSDYFMTICTQG